MAVRIMKMIPDEVGRVGLAFLNLSISIEVGYGNSVGVKLPQRNVFLFSGLYMVCSLVYLLIKIFLLIVKMYQRVVIKIGSFCPLL